MHGTFFFNNNEFLFLYVLSKFPERIQAVIASPLAPLVPGFLNSVRVPKHQLFIQISYSLPEYIVGLILCKEMEHWAILIQHEYAFLETRASRRIPTKRREYYGCSNRGRQDLSICNRPSRIQKCGDLRSCRISVCFVPFFSQRGGARPIENEKEHLTTHFC